MFESFEKTTGDVVAETPRPVVLGYRTAALILFVNALLATGIAVVANRHAAPVLQFVIACLLAKALYDLKSNWAPVILVLACVAGIVVTISVVMKAANVFGFLQVAQVWGVVVPLFLLLRGEPGPVRRFAAVALFCLLALPVYALSVLGLMGALPSQ